jgi:hypothetical protein
MPDDGQAVWTSASPGMERLWAPALAGAGIGRPPGRRTAGRASGVGCGEDQRGSTSLTLRRISYIFRQLFGSSQKGNPIKLGACGKTHL